MEESDFGCYEVYRIRNSRATVGDRTAHVSTTYYELAEFGGGDEGPQIQTSLDSSLELPSIILLHPLSDDFVILKKNAAIATTAITKATTTGELNHLHHLLHQPK